MQSQSRFSRYLADHPLRTLLRDQLVRPRPEAEFTSPRADCPHPERWHSRDIQSAEVEVTTLVSALVRAMQPDLVVETGTAYGQTARAIGKALQKNGHGELHTMDTNPALARRAERLCARLPVVVTCESSLDFVPPAPVDFAWFDSLIDLRIQEFRRYLPHMHSGTVVGFHDVGPQHPGLAEGIRQLADEGCLVPLFLPTPRGVCLAQVTPT